MEQKLINLLFFYDFLLFLITTEGEMHLSKLAGGQIGSKPTAFKT